MDKQRRVVLTDSRVRACKTTGTRYEIADAIVPGLILRVSAEGKRAYCLRSRFPNSKNRNPSRRVIGEAGVISLKDARETARAWLELLREGKDPKEEVVKARREEAARAGVTFGVVVEDFFARHLKGQRRGASVEREMRRDLLPRWKDKPVTEITRRDVVEAVESVKDRAPAQAHAAFSNARVFFSWAINRNLYGLEHSPCSLLKPAQLIGNKQPRTRVFAESEIAALWRATERLGGTYAAIYRMLLLTGARRSEVGGMRWSELGHDLLPLLHADREEREQVDWSKVPLEQRIWTVPAARFKANAEHLVPLPDEALALLAIRPRFAASDFVFTNDGKRPVDGYAIAKKRLDALFIEELCSEAPHWVIHDIRRTVRSQLSALRVSEVVAELTIGHSRRGIARVYDQHRYLDDIFEGLQAWQAKLRTIAAPKPDNVIPLRSSDAS